MLKSRLSVQVSSFKPLEAKKLPIQINVGGTMQLETFSPKRKEMFFCCEGGTLKVRGQIRWLRTKETDRRVGRKQPQG